MTKKQVVQYIINNADALADDINQQLFDVYEKDLHRLIKKSITDFYKSYSPRYYKRKYSLKNMYEIKRNKKSMSVNFGDSYTNKTHRVSNDYIYETVFKEGWHGGAKSIASEKSKLWGGHPDPGTPYWRKPPKPWEDEYGNEHPPYTEWGAMASSSLSPWERINRVFDMYISNNVPVIKQEIIKKELLKWIKSMR